MAISLVQTAAIGSTSSGSSQQTSAFGANPTVGNYVVAWAWGWNGGYNAAITPPTFSDTGGNSYTIPTNARQSVSADAWCTVGYAKVLTSGASFKVTAGTAGIAGGSIMVVAAEFSGVASASPLDGAAVGTTGTTGVPAPGSLTLTAGDLVVAVMCSDQTTYTTFGYSTPTGFSRIGFQNDGSTFEVGEGIYAINPSSPSNPSWKTGTVKWAVSQFALLAASTPQIYIPGPFPGISGSLLAV